ncbi:MAG: hypothetical protein R3265_05020 [Hyphomonas sp.]|nr:hypothetical protein [Hyphomonas sp.]
MKRSIGIGAVVCLAPVLAACETVNAETVSTMPSGYLCDLLSDNFITTPSERRAIFAELESREVDCVNVVEIRNR